MAITNRFGAGGRSGAQAQRSEVSGPREGVSCCTDSRYIKAADLPRTPCPTQPKIRGVRLD